MVKITPREIRALSSLKNAPEFSAVLEWIRRSHKDATQRMAKSNESLLFGRAQGEFNTLEEILNHADNAYDMAQKIR